MDEDRGLVGYAESLYSTINRNGDGQFAPKRSRPTPEKDHPDRSPIVRDERRIEDDGSIHDQDRIDLSFPSFGSDAETAAEAILSSPSPGPLATSLFDDDTLAQLLANFDAQLTQTMLSLDEAEKSIEEESNQQQQQQQQQQKSTKEKRMKEVTNGQIRTSGDLKGVDKSIGQRKDNLQRDGHPLGRPLNRSGLEGPASSAFQRNGPTFSSFKGSLPSNLQKKMVTFDDRIQTFVRPQSMHDSELSYNDHNDDDGRRPHQQQQQQQQQQQSAVMAANEKKDEEGHIDGEDIMKKDRQSRFDVQPQQFVNNESGIYEDVCARRISSLETSTDNGRYDEISTGSEGVDLRVKVKTSTTVSYDRHVPDGDALATAADGNDEFLSQGSEDDEEDDDDDEDTDFMIREADIKSPMTKVKALTVCRTLAVILAWLLAGIVAELPGPTMRYWSESFGVSEELLSRVLATDGLGIVLGALLGGAASSRRHSDSALAASMVLLACYPCTHSFLYYQLTAFLCAVARGAIFVGGLSAVVEMWQESRAAIWVHILHTTYSIGCFSAVHLSAPFVQYRVQVDGQLLWSDTSVQQVVYPPPVVQLVHNDDGNTTAAAGDTRTSFSASQPSFPSSSLSSAAAAAGTRDHFSIHVLYVPFVIVCFLLSLFFLCNSIRQTVQLLRRRNSIQRKRLLRQRNLNQHLKRQMTESELRKENLYEDTLKDRQTEEQTDADKVSNTAVNVRPEVNETSNKTGRVQPEVNKAVVESKKNGYVNTEDGVLNVAFAHAPPGQEFTTAGGSKQRGSRNAGSRRCIEEQQSDYRGRQQRIRQKSEVTPWFQGNQTFDIPILMFLYVCFVFPFGLEAVLGMFLSVYASSNTALQQHQYLQRLQSDDAALDIDVTVQLLSVFWASFILGRVLAASLSRFLSAGVLLIVFLTINVLAGAILSAYAYKYTTILWLFVAIFGGFLGPLIPGGLTWANTFLVATPKSIALAYCSAGLGWAICCWLSGFLVSYFGSSSLMYLVAGMSSLSVLLFIPVLMKLGAPGSRQRSRSVRKPLSTYV